MTRSLLPLGLVALLCAPALAQPDEPLGLPGSPLLPSRTMEDAEPVTYDAKADQEPVKAGKAIVRYLASLIDEGKVEAGAWHSLDGGGQGYMARITTRKWRAAINNAVESGETRRHLFEFKDVIGETVIVELHRSGEARGGLKASDTEVSVGARFDESPIPVDLRVEGMIYRDDTVLTETQRYRAILETARADKTFLTFRIGLEHGRVNGHNALRGVAGTRLAIETTPETPSDIQVRFYADLEVSVGGFVGEAGGPAVAGAVSHAYRGLAGLGVRNDRAGLTLEHAYEGEFAGDSPRAVIRHTTRVSGYVALDPDNVFQLYGKFGLEHAKNSFDPLAPLPSSVLRPSVGAGLSISPWAKRFKRTRGPTLNLGTDVREDLDGLLETRVTGTITIPW